MAPPSLSHSTRSGYVHSSKRTSTGRTSTTACARCRQKKKRCDQRLPKCRLCETAGVPCYGYDALTKRPVPRSYVHNLEERVAYLEAQLQTCASRCQHNSAAPDLNDTEPASDLQPSSTEKDSSTQDSRGEPASGYSPSNSEAMSDARATADRITNLTCSKPGHGAVFSRALLKIITSQRHTSHSFHQLSVNKEQPAESTTNALDIVDGLAQDSVTLPSRSTARNLIDGYFQFANLCMPLMHEAMFEEKVTMLFNLPQTIDLEATHTTAEARLAVFFVLEVFAIALLLKQKQDPLKVPIWLANRYHDTAVAALDGAGLPNSVEGVQALVLLGQYSYHHPAFEGTWRTVGAALRFAVEMGLHQEPASTDGMDPLTLDTMRRTFWVAYAMDRNVSRSLALPMFLPDGAISTKFPSAMRDEFIRSNSIDTAEAHVSASKLAGFHLLRHRLTQSEMQRVLYGRPCPPFAPVNLEQWQQQMRTRLDDWHNSIPHRQDPSRQERIVIETFEATYQTGLVYLYSPTPNIPSPSPAQLAEAAHAASQVIQLYRRFFSEHKLTIYWQAVENLCSAGTALLLGYVRTVRVREQITFRSLQALIQMCSSVLWGMAEHFPEGQPKRDAFDTMSSRILEDLGRNISTVEGREEVMLQDEDIGSDHPAGSITHPDGGHVASRDMRCSLLQEKQLLFSLPESRPLELHVASEISASEHTVDMPEQQQQQQQQQLPSSLPDEGLMPTYADPSAFLYEDFDDVSMLWDVTANFDGMFTPTWI